MYETSRKKNKKANKYFILLDLPIIGRVPQQHDANYCWPVTVPPPMRDRPPHWGLRPLLFTNSVWVL